MVVNTVAEQKKVNELLEKYKDEPLRFKSYFKYDFEYEGDGILVVLGGNADDIYRANLSLHETVSSIREVIGDESIWIEELPLE